jgi:hypothetical protein
MRRGVILSILVVMMVSSRPASGQTWGFDARTIAMGGVGDTSNLATKMIEEERDYMSIVLPIGLIQVLRDRDRFDPNSPNFDPIRALEYGAQPFYYVFGRDTPNAGEAAFISDIRNATLSRDLNHYRGFIPVDRLLAEGLSSPNYGGTIKFLKQPDGGFQGIYIGAGPYLSLHTLGIIDQGLRNILMSSSPVVVPRNAHFPLFWSSDGQLALAVTGGYRGRFGWPVGVGKGTKREGLYVAANYNYLHGFRYENIDLGIALDTDNSGLITLAPTGSPLVITKRESTTGTGFALDFGVGAVIEGWEIGFGANGVANRINWSTPQLTTYTLPSLLSGNSNFSQSPSVTLAETRIELPVDYRGSLAYRADRWTAAVDGGHGFGGASFHTGAERRLGNIELRGGARYTTFEKWNPTGGIGFEFSDRVALDVAAFGTSKNLERKRQLALAASIRINFPK